MSFSIQARVMVIMMRDLLGSFNGATYALILSPSRLGMRHTEQMDSSGAPCASNLQYISVQQR